MIREELKRATAYTVLVSSLLSMIPLPASAYEVGGYSSPAIDRGIVIGVYDPYYREMKIIHYWLVKGKGFVDKDSNTVCTYLGDALTVGVGTKKVSCLSGWELAKDTVGTIKNALNNPNVKVSPLVNQLYYCPDNKLFAIKTNDGYFEASYSFQPVSVCRRIVDPNWINRKFKPNVKFDAAQSGTDGMGLRNVRFIHIPFGSDKKGAIQLLSAYTQATGASAAIFAVEGLHFHKHKHKCGLFRKCIDYIWDEKVSYYELGRAPSISQAGGGLYLSQKGIASNLYVHSDRIKKITKKGWSFITVVVAQVALVALTGGVGVGALANVLGAGFLTNDVVSGLQGGWGSGAYRLGEGITPGAFNDFSKDFGKNSDPGSDALHSRFVSATDLNPKGLDGFVQASKIYSNYKTNWAPSAVLTSAVVKTSALKQSDKIFDELKESISEDFKEIKEKVGKTHIPMSNSNWDW